MNIELLAFDLVSKEVGATVFIIVVFAMIGYGLWQCNPFRGDKHHDRD